MDSPANGDPNFEATMTTRDSKAHRGARFAAVVFLGLAVTHSGCGLDDVKIPDLQGPSELGTSLKLTATPDVITADGFSTSLIQVQVFDQNGSPAAGRQVILALADSGGRFADIGSLRSTSTGALVRATEAIVTSGSNGVATAIYTAPPRTDATADQSVSVLARPVGTDANAAVYRSVKIELKSAEPRLFPQPTGANSAPSCNFVIETPSGAGSCTGTGSTAVCTVKANTTILFQSTSFDSDGRIVRYEWFFGDGTPVNYDPDTPHVFKVGDYTVTHRVTDNFGLQSACSTTLTAE